MMNEDNNKKCDLHIHSNFSDSDLSVENIFKIAKEKRLSCIAISDHDTIDGTLQARVYSKTYNIELIEAVELSAQKNDVELHILGYFLNIEQKKLKEVLDNAKELRRERFLLMAKKLEALGIMIDKDKLLLKIKNSIPTRLHLALHLKELGIVTSLYEAFNKYLSPGKPGYAVYVKYSVKDMISIIKESNGLAFIAHPHNVPDKSWIEEFISYGLDGLEVACPGLRNQKGFFYNSIADKFKLLKSGGSDSHGSYKEFTGIGEIPVSYKWAENIKDNLMLKNFKI